MLNTLIHRGPDDEGIWMDAAQGIALGHRRLAIQDLSDRGRQPMVSPDGRYVLIFNGEIYNFLALRQELEGAGHSFHGSSDTEVMLHAFSRWGVLPAVQRFNGMFAFAVWDVKERALHLGRDRLGEKPLYYGMIERVFLFGSELKALKAYPEWCGEIDRDVLTLFLRHNYVPTPYSIYTHVKKLPPAMILTIRDDDSEIPEPIPYWNFPAIVGTGIANPCAGSDADAVEQLEAVLLQSTKGQMVADVPLGAFLSGGIDSSVIVALMQLHNSRPVKTFTIGFEEEGYNEAIHAKAVAEHLGTDHTELYVTADEARAVIPKLPILYDEPFADSSQIPTFLVAQMAKKHVTVCLSGDAGDELFGGYQRYVWGRNIWNTVGWIPQTLRRGIAGVMRGVYQQIWDQMSYRLKRLLPREVRKSVSGDKIHKLAGILDFETSEALYQHLMCPWKEPEVLMTNTSWPSSNVSEPLILSTLSEFIQRMMYVDTLTYLPDDILVKVDRASMGVSLETRVPFLDRRVVEFAWRIPLSMKVRHGQTKWILRQVLYKYVPKDLVERPKKGFAVPVGAWLRGPLREWVEALLDERRLREEGIFNPKPIRQKWTEHLSGIRNWQHYLWNILMFQAWHACEKK